ncbi:hypothetical protein K8R33_02185 [archaeon]|nr:hypothetical protein [archaeon]
MASLRDIVEENDFVLLDTCALCAHVDNRESVSTQIRDCQKTIDLFTEAARLIELNSPLFISDGVEREIRNYYVVNGPGNLTYNISSQKTRDKLNMLRKYGVALKKLSLKFKDTNRIISLSGEDIVSTPELGYAISYRCRDIGETDSKLLYIAALKALKGNSVALLTRDSGIQSAWRGLLYDSQLVTDRDLKFYWAKSPRSFVRKRHERFSEHI